ncbi:MAG: hypothetical protein ABR517_08905 [Thermoanaerobaculia bacterium]
MTRAWVVVLSLFLVLFGGSAFGQCEFRSAFDLRFRDTALDLSLDGNDLWVATGWGVALWDAAAERPVTSLSIERTTVAVQAVPGGAWVGSGTSVQFVEAAPHLARRAGVDLGAAVSDLVISGNYLYAATSAGVIQIDIADRAGPAVAASLPTTSGAAISVAILGAFLYAADGDSTVEAYSIQIPSLPQKIGTVDSLPRSVGVSALDHYLVVSDGQQSEIFSGSGTALGRVALLPFSGTAAARWSGSVHFLAGGGREVHAVDVLAPRPTIVSSATTELTSGNTNRVSELVASGSKLWAAAGDAGVEAWRLTGFAPPYPLRLVRTEAIGSSWISGARAVIALSSGGLQRFSDSSGQLVPGPVWQEGSISRILDGEADRILTSTGQELRLWDIAPSTPTSLGAVTLSGAIRSGALHGSVGWAIVADNSLWRVDFSAQPPAAAQVAVGGSPDFVVASSAGFATADILEDGNTRVRFVPGVDPANSASEVTIEGASNGGIAMGASPLVAAATFRGITLIDFGAGGSTKIVPGTNQSPIRGLRIEGDRLILVTGDRIEVRTLDSGALLRALPTGVTLTSISASASRAIASSMEGFAIADLETASRQPEQIALPDTASRYYRSLATDGDLLWLGDAQRIDLYRTDSSAIPRHQAEVSFEGSAPPVGFTAAAGRLFTISATGTLESWRADGSREAALSIDEGSLQQIDGITSVGGAVWVSITRNCLSTGCEKLTVVIDTRSGITRSTAFNGGTVDAIAHGDLAAVVTTLPSEVRLYDISDPAHPRLVSSTAASGGPVSVDFDATRVWVLGDRLRAYSRSGLDLVSTHFDAWTADPLGRVSYLDQTIRVVGSCMLVAGRTAVPTLWNAAGESLTPLPAPDVPDAVRGAAVSGSSIHLLGEYALQTWSSAPPAERSRPVRR